MVPMDSMTERLEALEKKKKTVVACKLQRNIAFIPSQVVRDNHFIVPSLVMHNHGGNADFMQGNYLHKLNSKM